MGLICHLAMCRFLLSIVGKYFIFQMLYSAYIYSVLADAAGGELFCGVVFLGGPPKAVINVLTAYLVSVGLSTADLSCEIAQGRACQLRICSGSLPAINKTNF